MLDWLGSLINPGVRWLDSVQSIKPICSLDWSLRWRLAWLWIVCETQLRDGLVEWPVKPICWYVFPYSLINPSLLAWLNCMAPLAMYDSASVSLIPVGNHAHLGVGSVAERLRSTLAYGWVEHYSDIVGCGTSSVQDKCSCLCYSLQLYSLFCELLDGMWWTCCYVEWMHCSFE